MKVSFMTCNCDEAALFFFQTSQNHDKRFFNAESENIHNFLYCQQTPRKDQKQRRICPSLVSLGSRPTGFLR